jgi:hypothetical protein
MKKSTLLLGALLSICTAATAEVIVLNGIYNGKDLYVKNSVTSSGLGFCAFEVIVNGTTTTDELNMSVFGVDFKSLALKMGEEVEIVIRCKEDCGVRVLNPEVLHPESTFQVESVLVNKTGHLEWSTKNERGQLPYNIEQYKWKRWVKVGETMGAGDEERNTYTMDLALHSGVNIFRVSQKDHRGQRVSNDIKVESKAPLVALIKTTVTKSIDFTSETAYEIYSSYGEKVGAGTAKNIDIQKFPRGEYLLNFDNQSGVLIQIR